MLNSETAVSYINHYTCNLLLFRQRSCNLLQCCDSQLAWYVAGNHGPVSQYSKSANFTAGFHSIELDFCNMGGTAALSLLWKGPNATTYSVRAVPSTPETEYSLPSPHNMGPSDFV